MFKQICKAAKYDNSFCYEINFTPNPTKRKVQKNVYCFISKVLFL